MPKKQGEGKRNILKHFRENADGQAGSLLFSSSCEHLSAVAQGMVLPAVDTVSNVSARLEAPVINE